MKDNTTIDYDLLRQILMNTLRPELGAARADEISAYIAEVLPEHQQPKRPDLTKGQEFFQW